MIAGKLDAATFIWVAKACHVAEMASIL